MSAADPPPASGVPPSPSDEAAPVRVSGADETVPARASHRSSVVPWLAVGAALVLGLALTGQIDAFFQGGLTYVPFIVLAVLAYLGVRHEWARAGTVVWLLGALVGSAALLAGSLTTQALEELGAAAPPWADTWLLPAIGAGFALAVVCYTRPVRGLAARVLPLDPTSFVHATALATVVSLTWLACVPLLLLGEAPLLVPGVFTPEDQPGVSATGQQLAELATALVWTVPSALIVVGFPFVRRLDAALRRLAFVWPTRRQVLAGLGVAVALAILIDPLSVLINVVWQALGWPLSSTESVERLFARDLNPVGAVVIGVTAGLSEELLCRGVLQPRLGLVLPNVFFTALHAYQYNWDGLLTVFLLGLVFAVLRERTNTSTCALAHGFYDFLVVMMAVLGVPGLSALFG